jgi:spore coat protein U-like protein
MSFVAATVLPLCVCKLAMADTYSCDVTVASVSFGAYQRTLTLNGSGTVYVNCRLTSGQGQTGVPYSIAMSTGQSGTYMMRTLSTSSAATLQYNLYTDSSYSSVWGDGSGGTGVVSGVLLGTSFSRTHPIYGRISAIQNTPKGSFSDPAVQATISF